MFSHYSASRKSLCKKMRESGYIDLYSARPPRSKVLPVPPLSLRLHSPCSPAPKPVPTPCRSRPVSPCALSLCSTRASSTGLISRRVITEPVACSAKAWAVTSSLTGDLLLGKQEESPREIASLTKIMTLYTALQLLKELGLSLACIALVSHKAAGMKGTSAGLQAEDTLKVMDLLYGLMLPSGNDAAQCLAEFFGREIAASRSIPGSNRGFDLLFVREMNQQAGKLSLGRTVYQNPHGMAAKQNFSTAKDVNTLACIAMRLSTFRSIVNTQCYSCNITNEAGEEREQTWENTNKLLRKGFEGVKTGLTEGAGPCLCSSWREVVVTVLGCGCREGRWEDVQRLVAWAQSSSASPRPV